MNANTKSIWQRRRGRTAITTQDIRVGHIQFYNLKRSITPHGDQNSDQGSLRPAKWLADSKDT